LPELPPLSGREVIGALTRAGFAVDRQEGSHVILVHGERHLVAVVPTHGGRDIPTGTLRKIVRQAGLSVAEFVDLLK
jgi:predicted RNA binding protein YcfA (HicA-like mRNA interferase family)